jgi:hypothetical protein
MAPARAAVIPDQKGTFSMGSSHTLDQFDVCFDDTHAVANAGLLLPATLAEWSGKAFSDRPSTVRRYILPI